MAMIGQNNWKAARWIRKGLATALYVYGYGAIQIPFLKQARIPERTCGRMLI